MKNLLIAILFLSGINAFGQSNAQEKGGIKLTPVTDSPLFPESSLKQVSPEDNSVLSINAVRFKYEVKNFELTIQTTDAQDKHCSNSAKGQHIHLILNNEPYLAKYESDFTETLKDGHYVALSFLSRSYHESLKHKKAYSINQFTVGNQTYPKVDLKKPLLFYSRPKAEYVGDDAKKVLLDFYLVNVKLSPNGYKVKATINGTEFIITDWQAYAMEGLPLGENTIKLELLDKTGAPVKSAYNSSERKITLK